MYKRQDSKSRKNSDGLERELKFPSIAEPKERKTQRMKKLADPTFQAGGNQNIDDESSWTQRVNPMKSSAQVES